MPQQLGKANWTSRCRSANREGSKSPPVIQGKAWEKPPLFRGSEIFTAERLLSTSATITYPLDPEFLIYTWKRKATNYSIKKSSKDISSALRLLDLPRNRRARLSSSTVLQAGIRPRLINLIIREIKCGTNLLCRIKVMKLSKIIGFA